MGKPEKVRRSVSLDADVVEVIQRRSDLLGFGSWNGYLSVILRRLVDTGALVRVETEALDAGLRPSEPETEATS